MIFIKFIEIANFLSQQWHSVSEQAMYNGSLRREPAISYVEPTAPVLLLTLVRCDLEPRSSPVISPKFYGLGLKSLKIHF